MKITTVTTAMLRGTTPITLTLTYDERDPAAIRVDLACQSWYVERAELVRSLRGAAPTNTTDDKCVAAAWHCCPLSVPGRALLVLRSQRFGRLPMSLPLVDLIDFLTTTYRMCSPNREQRLLEVALDAQLNLFATQEGNQ